MRNLIALLAATTLAGCVNMAPKHERPALPTAPAPLAMTSGTMPRMKARLVMMIGRRRSFTASITAS